MLSCGCEIKPGLRVTLEQARAHARHTVEALLFWNLLLNTPEQPKEKLIMARLEVQDALDLIAPGWSEDLGRA